MLTSYLTKRLSLKELSLEDDVFIMTLVNTPEWLRFIGDREVRTAEESKEFIQKTLGNVNANCWVVRLPDRTPIGIITFMKRNYLEHYDIGFALLKEHTGKGYAYEATLTILTDIITKPTHSFILATTLKDNVNSIKLLTRLGLTFEKEINNGTEDLLVYSVSVDQLLINQLTNEFFGLFTNLGQTLPSIHNIHNLCLPESIIIKKSKDKEEVYNLSTFIVPREKILTDGTLMEFEEYEIAHETKIVGHLAQRFSVFQKRGYLNGNYFDSKGKKLFQFIKTTKGWQINSVIWEDDIN